MWKPSRLSVEQVRAMNSTEQYQYIRNDPNKFVHLYAINAPNDYQDQFLDKITRCVTTQYAVTAFFCGDEIAHVELDEKLVGGHTEDFKRVIHGLQNLFDRTGSQKRIVFRVDELGHTWVVTSLPNGNFRMYQSYILFYTLEDHLRRNGTELTHADMYQFMEDIDTLEHSMAWTEPVDALYKKWFGVSLLYDKKQWETYGQIWRWRKLNFSWDIACVV